MTQVILSGYRYVQIEVDDTLQSIAARELGDADLWRILISINGLSYPYISGDPTLIGDTVLGYGAQLIVPAPTIQVSSAVDPNRVFGVDVALQNGLLAADGADFACVGGNANLKQALQNRLDTPLGELLFHQAYGNGAHGIKGVVVGPTANLLTAQYVKGALLADPRIDSVQNLTSVAAGDAITTTATAVPVSGTSIDLAATV